MIKHCQGVTKIGRLRWLGHLFRTQDLDHCRKLTVLKTNGTRRVGKRKLSWLESAEEDLKKMGVRNWISKKRDREQWRTYWKKLRFTKDYNVRRRGLNQGD